MKKIEGLGKNQAHQRTSWQLAKTKMAETEEHLEEEREKQPEFLAA